MGHKQYQISIERNGQMVPVGQINGENYETAQFAYSDQYLKDGNAVPVSISLPLQRESFSVSRTRHFFEGLLPEGFTRRSVAQWLHLDENDYLSILHQLGKECLGAIQMLAAGETQTASYEKITEQQVKALAAEGAQKSAEIVTKSHLSLTGASGKVGLYYDESGDQWYLPGGTAPSTHIVKQSHVRLEGIVTNEQLSMRAAAKCGIDVPDSFIIDLGSGKDSEVLYATKRFDRTFKDSAKTIEGLRCPLRLHQEDFSQAMGIPSAQKYEKDHAGYMRRMFDILRKYSANPIQYDLVSTTVYESSTREMAFSVGNAVLIDEITEHSFREAASEIHIGERFAIGRYNYICEHFREALREAADELMESGFSKAGEIEEKILRTGGFARI